MRWALRLTFWADAVLMGEGADLTVALAAWGLGGGARGSGGFWVSASHGSASPGQGRWFPKNVARNFHVNLSNFELASLELQRF